MSSGADNLTESRRRPICELGSVYGRHDRIEENTLVQHKMEDSETVY